MTFKNNLVVFLLVSLVWYVIEQLHVPGWAVGLIALPLSLFVGLRLMLASSERASRNPQPLPTGVAYAARLKRLGMLAGSYEALGFRYADGFLMPSFPEVLVFLLRHAEEPITVALYDMGTKATTDLGTAFEDDWELDTSTQTEHSGHRRERSLLQHFGSATPDELVARHRDAIAFLREQGLSPRLDDGRTPRDEFLESIRRTYAEMRAKRFWMLRMLGGHFTNAGRRMSVPIREQYANGLPGRPWVAARGERTSSADVLAERAAAMTASRPAPAPLPRAVTPSRGKRGGSSLQRQLAITLTLLAISGGITGWAAVRERRDLATLRSGVSAERRAALQRLRHTKIEPAKLVPALAAAAGDPDAAVRSDVLATWSERAPGDAALHLALGGALADPEGLVRKVAARRIAALDESQATDALRDQVLARIGDGSAPAELRADALGALGAWMPRDRRADEALLAAFGDADPAVRLAAVRLISSPRLRAIDSSAALAAHLADPDRRVRRLVGEALARAGADANGDAVVALVARRLDEQDPLVRASAVATLDLMAERTEAPTPALAEALRDVDARHRHSDAELRALLHRIDEGSAPLTRVDSFARFGGREIDYTTPEGWMVAVRPVGDPWLERVESPDGRVTGRASLAARAAEIAEYDPSYDVALARYGIVHEFVLKLDAVPAFAAPLVHEPAAEADIQAFESRYGVSLPEHVRAFLHRTNGFGATLPAAVDLESRGVDRARAGIWPIAEWRHPSEVTEQRWLRKFLAKLEIWATADEKRALAESRAAGLEKSFIIGRDETISVEEIVLRPPHAADNDDWDVIKVPLIGGLEDENVHKVATLDAVANSLAALRFEGRSIGAGGAASGDDAIVDDILGSADDDV